MIIQSVFLLLASCLLSNLVSSTTSSHKSIEQGFYNCVDLPGVPLAHDLMRSVWNDAARNSFPQTYSALVHPESFSFENMDYSGTEDLWKTKVRFSKPPLIAGVPASGMTAFTCRNGCGWASWTLDFDVLSNEQVNKLRNWVEKAPATEMENMQEPAKTSLHQYDNGLFFLVCDLSD